jgi:hypothetical protein
LSAKGFRVASGNHSDIRADIEEISRSLIYDIHIFRAVNTSDLWEIPETVTKNCLMNGYV